MSVARAAAAKLQQVRAEITKRKAHREQLKAVEQVLHELNFPVGDVVGDLARK